MLVVVVSCVVVVATVVSAYERHVNLLRTELNSCRANEQLLLSRLSARSLPEFSWSENAAKVESPAPSASYLYDQTGLVRVEDSE